ncbi:hypothetical protein KKG22_01280 [Patescibacteria group bacterium]|nr:hypothetical protein [Patescibacteria group bacterium]MBU1722066.1 hypothetical protein [Patescibacteria group bacterium]MBU1901537.1 hypothetical protein [Patescibacteria group bacterium]
MKQGDITLQGFYQAFVAYTQKVDAQFSKQDELLDNIAIQVTNNTELLKEHNQKIDTLQTDMSTVKSGVDFLLKKDKKYETENASHKSSYNRLNDTQEEHTEQIAENKENIVILKKAMAI